MSAPAETGRGLDHLVLAVRDLEAAAVRYGAMGFQVGTRNRHPWGTENRLVQFPGAFLELITVPPGTAIEPTTAPAFGFAGHVDTYLRLRGEGFAMLALESRDAAGDKAQFDAAGIGGFDTFFFERRGRRPDGSDVRVAFTLAFAADEAMPGAGFFTCEQHEPGNFWNPAFQRHPNGVTGMAGVIATAPVPGRHRAFLEAFSGCLATPTPDGGLVLDTPRGTIEMLTPDAAAARIGGGAVAPAGPRLSAFRLHGDRARAIAALDEGGVPYRRGAGGHAVVAAADAFGVAIIFEEGTP